MCADFLMVNFKMGIQVSPYFSSIFQTMRLSVEEFIAKLSWRDSMLTLKVCRAYTHLSPPKPLSSAYQWERELVGRLE